MVSANHLGKKICHVFNSISAGFFWLLVNYPIVIVITTSSLSIIVCTVGVWKIEMPKFDSNPTEGFVTSGTPISASRSLKESIMKMEAAKELFTINDMIRKGPEETKSTDLNQNERLISQSENLLNNFVSILSNEQNNNDLISSIDENENTEEIIDNILSHLSLDKRSNAFKRKFANRKKRSHNDFGSVRDQLDFGEDIFDRKASTKLSYLECSPIFSDNCAQIVIESKEPDKKSLLSYEFLNVQCQFIEQFLKPYLRNLQLSNQKSSPSIKFEALTTVLTRFANKKSCIELDMSDVNNFTIIFKYCTPIYKKMAHLDLMQYPTFEQAQEFKLPSICLDQNLFDAYKYLIEKNFEFKDETRDTIQFELQSILANNNFIVEPPLVKHTSIYFSINKRDPKFLVPFYQNYLLPNFVNKALMENSNYRIVGLNFDIKGSLFSAYIWSNSVYLILAIVLVLIVTLIYTKSFLLALAVLSTILFASIESYLLYRVLFKISMFSYVNLLSIFALVANVCNFVFVFYDTWCEAKQMFSNELPAASQVLSSRKHENIVKTRKVTFRAQMMPVYLENCARYTFKHGVYGLLFTNLTTLAGFLVNLGSSIVAIRLFGIYATLAILAQLVLVILIVPSILILNEKYSKDICAKLPLLTADFKLKRQIKDQLITISDFYQRIFEDFLPKFIISFRFILITSFSLLAILSLVLIIFKPGFTLANRHSVQLFASSNPLEKYDEHFSATSPSNGIYLYQDENKAFLKIFYVFGVLNRPVKENSNDKNSPLSSQIQLDEENFDFYDEKNQLWLSQFCKALTDEESKSSQEFKPKSGMIDDEDEEQIKLESDLDENLENLPTKTPICLFDLLKSSLSRKCSKNLMNSVNSSEIEPATSSESLCCEQRFPFDSNILKHCLRGNSLLMNQLASYQNQLYEKLYFNKTSGLVKIVEFQQSSGFLWTTDHAQMRQVHESIDQFFKKQTQYKIVDLSGQMETSKQHNLATNGFFVSDFDLYDFQKGLLFGTLQSTSIMVLVVFFTALISTRNLKIALFTLVSVTASVLCTVATLALFGCKLELVESLLLTLSFGICTNFVIHLGISYCNLISNEFSRSQELTSLFFCRETNTKKVLKSQGSAMFLTGLVLISAGLTLIPCTLVSYQVLGIFMITLTLFTLLYSFGLFLPLCAILGPTNSGWKSSKQLNLKRPETVQPNLKSNAVKIDVSRLKEATKCNTLSTTIEKPTQIHLNEGTCM